MKIRNRFILKCIMVFALHLYSLLLFGGDKEVRIGVLANCGSERCLAKWSATANYLTKKIDGYEFLIVPLSFKEIYSSVKKHKVDFLLANPAFYIAIEYNYGAKRIVTLIKKHNGLGYDTFAGVVFTRKDNENINDFYDLKNRSFMATDETSFGGYIMAWCEFQKIGINPQKDFSELYFGNTHDRVVYAVLDGKVDAGTVRSDTLERMAREGKISLNDLKVLNHCESDCFPLMHSTAYYPEWPLAKLKQTSDELAEKVVIALLEMPSDSLAAKASFSKGWTIPGNYQDVEECLKSISFYPFDNYGKVTFLEALRQHWISTLSVLFLVLVLLLFAIYVIKSNREIIKSKRKLIHANDIISRTPGVVFRWKNEKGWPVEFVSDNIKELTEFTSTELKKEGFLYSSLIDSEDLNRIELEIEDACSDHNLQFFCHQTYRIRSKSNHIKWVDSAMYIFRNKDGVITHFEGLLCDITKRKLAVKALRKSENNLRVTLNSIGDGVISTNLKGEVLQINQLAEKLTGWSLKEAKGEIIRDVFNIISSQSGENIKNPIEEVLETHKNLKLSNHIKLTSKDGYVYQISTAASPIKDDDNKIIGAVVVFRDITRELKIREDLQRMQNWDSISRLTGSIAHEFNNPLQGLISILNVVVKQSKSDENIVEQIGLAINECHRMRDLVQGMQEFDVPKSDQVAVIDIHKIFDTLLMVLKKRYVENGIVIVKKYYKDMTMMLGIPEQIKQVLMNLLTNAIDACNDNGKITITTELFKDYIIIKVHNTGKGIKKKDQTHIFEPFVSTKIDKKGSGLGLSVSYGIVKSHGGELEVESKEGDKGVTFTLILPRSYLMD